MKPVARIVMAFGGFCVASSLVGTVAFADTNTTVTNVQNPQLQADRAAMKQLFTENKQLTQQIKTDVQAWQTANPNPFKQLTADQQTTVKDLQSEIKSEQSTLKPLRVQFKSLRSQLKTAKQNKDTATVAQLKAQIQPLLTSIKADAGTIKSYRQQIQAVLPASTMKAFRTKHQAYWGPLKTDRATLKQAGQQLRTDEHTLKADRQNHKTTALDADIQKVNSDLNQMIVYKQQLLKDLSTVAPTSSVSPSTGSTT